RSYGSAGPRHQRPSPAREPPRQVSTGLRRLSAPPPPTLFAAREPTCPSPERQSRGRTATPPTGSSPRFAYCPPPTAALHRGIAIASEPAGPGPRVRTGRIPPAGPRAAVLPSRRKIG